MAHDIPPDDEQYETMYRAQHDALWDVIGTIAYAIFIFIGFLVGIWVFAFAMAMPSYSMSGVFALLGLALLIVSIIRFVKLFDLIPNWL
jgi:membrane protein YdbS with pleckstrin-like domain